jgi:hypothetical protein
MEETKDRFNCELFELDDGKYGFTISFDGKLLTTQRSCKTEMEALEQASTAFNTHINNSGLPLSERIKECSKMAAGFSHMMQFFDCTSPAKTDKE